MILRWLQNAIVVAPIIFYWKPSIPYHEEFRGQVTVLLWYNGTPTCIKNVGRYANNNC